MDIPTAEELAEQLQAVSGAGSVGIDEPLLLIADVDSLDLMEWLYGLQTRYPHIPADESLFADLDGSVTVQTVHDRLVALVAQPTVA